MNIKEWLTRFRKSRDAAAMKRADERADETPAERAVTSGDIEAIKEDEFAHQLTRDTPSEGERLGE